MECLFKTLGWPSRDIKVTDGKIKELEAAMDFAFPDAYKDFIAQYGSAIPALNNVDYLDSNRRQQWLSGIYFFSAEELESCVGIAREGGVLPIGVTREDDMLVIDMNQCDGAMPVLYLDFEKDKNDPLMAVLSDSFETFIRKMLTQGDLTRYYFAREIRDLRLGQLYLLEDDLELEGLTISAFPKEQIVELVNDHSLLPEDVAIILLYGELAEEYLQESYRPYLDEEYMVVPDTSGIKNFFESIEKQVPQDYLNHVGFVRNQFMLGGVNAIIQNNQFNRSEVYYLSDTEDQPQLLYRPDDTQEKQDKIKTIYETLYNEESAQSNDEADFTELDQILKESEEAFNARKDTQEWNDQELMDLIYETTGVDFENLEGDKFEEGRCRFSKSNALDEMTLSSIRTLFLAESDLLADEIEALVPFSASLEDDGDNFGIWAFDYSINQENPSVLFLREDEDGQTETIPWATSFKDYQARQYNDELYMRTYCIQQIRAMLLYPYSDEEMDDMEIELMEVLPELYDMDWSQINSSNVEEMVTKLIEGPDDIKG